MFPDKSFVGLDSNLVEPFIVELPLHDQVLVMLRWIPDICTTKLRANGTFLWIYKWEVYSVWAIPRLISFGPALLNSNSDLPPLCLTISGGCAPTGTLLCSVTATYWWVSLTHWSYVFFALTHLYVQLCKQCIYSRHKVNPTQLSTNQYDECDCNRYHMFFLIPTISL